MMLRKKAIRNFVLEERVRLDGRKLDQIRPIWCEVDYLPIDTWFRYFHPRRNTIIGDCYP